MIIKANNAKYPMSVKMIGKSLQVLVIVILVINLSKISEGKIIKIIGGHEAKPHSHPYIILMEKNDKPWCDGSIIDEKWILTAEHCVKDRDPNQITYHAVAGIHNRSNYGPTAQRVKVEKIIVHPKYEGDLSPNDIALLKLTEPLKFNKFVQPINLPESHSNSSGQCILAGWGATVMFPIPKRPDVLKEIKLTLMSPEECKRIRPNYFDEFSNICTSTTEEGIGACNGDSGSPLVQQISGKTIQIGIAAWAPNNCSDPNDVDGFTKVSSFIDFIHDSIKNN